MKLTKVRLGDYIEICSEKNVDGRYTNKNLKGVANSKKFIKSLAKMKDSELKNYIIVEPKSFAYVTITSRNGEKISLAYNDSNDIYIVSSSYLVFKVVNPNELLPEYLFMIFNRGEFDRYSRFHSWGTTREAFSWEEMCNIKLDLPDIEIQKKYVNIYKSMVANQKAYEKGLEDLKLVCDGYIEDLRHKYTPEKIGPYIEEIDERNSDNFYSVNDVRGISIEKLPINTKADMSNVKVNNYKIVKYNEFAFNPNTARMGDKLAITINRNNPFLVSSIYPTFKCIDKLDPFYLMIYLSKSNFDRFALFNSWGSAREIFTIDSLKNYKIPIPDISVQESIVKIYNAYIKRKEINEKLKAQLKDMCPILIRGAIEEAKRS